MRLAFEATLVLFVPLVSFAQPVLPSNGVVNTADYTANIAPGTLISLFGSGFATGLTSADKTPLPTILGGATVELNDGSGSTWTPLPLFFVAPTQINGQFPFDFHGKTVQVRVRNASGISAAASINLQAVAPRLLTKSMDGRGEAILTDAMDYKLVSAAVPARGNEYLTLYLTGLGAVTGTAVAGKPAGDNGANGPLNATVAQPAVSIGGTPAQVLWAGLAPGWIGLYQMNVQVAGDTPTGSQIVTVAAGAAKSQDNVLITVSAPATLLAEASISAANGGTVSGGGAQVQIPPGAIPADAVVRISKVIGPPPEDNQASDTYVIRGLPSSLAAPIELTLPTNFAVDPNKTLVVTQQLWGAGDFAQPQGAQTMANTPLAAARASDQLSVVTVTLPAAPAPPADQTDSEIEYHALTNYARIECPSGNFAVFYPDVDPFNTHIPKICGWLDDTRQKLESQTGTVFGIQRTRWPFRAVYGTLTGYPDRWGEHIPGANGDINYDSIWLNLTPVKQAIASGTAWEDEMHATIGHELFHFVQNAYDSRPPATVAKVPSRDLWFEEGLSTWFEGAVLGQSNYIATSVSGYAWQYLFAHALQFSQSSCTWAFLRSVSQHVWGQDPCTDVQDYGYASSLLLGTIAQYKGGTALGDAMKAALSGNQTGAQALAATLGGTLLGGYWTKTARSLVESNYSANWPPQLALLSVAQTNGLEFRPSFTDPTRKTLVDSWSAQDLSMHLDKITLDESLPAGAELTLKFSQSNPNVTAYVYQYDPKGATTLIDSFTDTVTVPDADKLAAAKATLLVLIVQSRCLNACTGTIPVALTFGAVGPPDWVVLSTNVKADFTGDLNFTDNDTGKWCGGGTVFGTVESADGSIPIGWTGLTFRGSAGSVGWPNANKSVNYTVSGTLDKSATTILSMTFHEDVSDGTSYDLNIGNIAVAPNATFSDKIKTFHYEVTGPAAASQTSGTMTYKNCTGTWTPSSSGDGVDVLLFRP